MQYIKSVRKKEFEIWKSGSLYHIDDIVLYNDKFYRCLTANIDSVFTESKWKLIG